MLGGVPWRAAAPEGYLLRRVLQGGGAAATSDGKRIKTIAYVWSCYGLWPGSGCQGPRSPCAWTPCRRQRWPQRQPERNANTCLAFLHQGRHCARELCLCLLTGRKDGVSETWNLKFRFIVLCWGMHCRWRRDRDRAARLSGLKSPCSRKYKRFDERGSATSVGVATWKLECGGTCSPGIHEGVARTEKLEDAGTLFPLLGVAGPWEV